MSFEQIKLKYYLHKCQKIENFKLEKSKSLLFKTYELSIKNDKDCFKNQTIFVNNCIEKIHELKYNDKIPFTDIVYNCIIYKLKRNNKLNSLLETEEYLNKILDLLIEGKNYDLLFNILQNGVDIFSIGNSFDNEYMINSKESINKIIKAIMEGDYLNIDKQLYIAKNYREYISIKKIEDVICYFKIPHHIYSFALNIDGANIKRLENAIIETNDIGFIYKFAFISGSDISRIEDYILNVKSNEYIIKLFNIPGCDIEKIENYIFNSKDPKLIYNYIVNYSYNESALKKFIDMHDYDLLYKLRNNKNIFLTKEMRNLIDQELFNSDNELYFCSSIIENEKYIDEIFGCKDNMLLFLANKYCEEKKTNWIKLYNKLKSQMDNKLFDNYYNYLNNKVKLKKID